MMTPGVNGRILFVIGSLNYGGTEKHLVQVLPRLAQLGWHVEVFTMAEPGEQAPLLTEQGIPVHAPLLGPRFPQGLPYRGLRLGSAAVSLSGQLVRQRPDIVHLFLPQAYVFGAGCASLVGHRCLVMSRRSRNLYQRQHPHLARAESFMHRRMSAILGNSRAVIADLRDEGIPDKKLGLIYNGVDLAAFATPGSCAAIRRAFSIADDELVLVKVANLIAYKGHADLLHALARTSMPVPWRLLCIGHGPEIRDQLQGLAKTLGLTERVIWAGTRSDVPAILAAADIGVLCSHEEGFSNAILEYMAAGLPTVVTDVGGNAEAVQDGVTGFVVPPRDHLALAAALAKAVEPQARRRMGAAARSRVEVNFSLEKCVAAYGDLYQSLLDGVGIPERLQAGGCAGLLR